MTTTMSRLGIPVAKLEHELDERLKELAVCRREHDELGRREFRRSRGRLDERRPLCREVLHLGRLGFDLDRIHVWRQAHRELQPAVRHLVPRLRGDDDDRRGNGVDVERAAVSDLCGHPAVVTVDAPERCHQ